MRYVLRFFVALWLAMGLGTANAQLLRYKTVDPTQVIDFTMQDADGKMHRISDYKGKIVVINFWATWCPPCVKEMPSLNNLAQSFPEDHFVVIAVCKDPQNKEAALKLFSSYDQKRLPLFFEHKDEGSSHALGIKGLPTTYVLDRKGYLVGQMTGGTEWDHHEVLEMMQGYIEGRTPQPASWWQKFRQFVAGA